LILSIDFLGLGFLTDKKNAPIPKSYNNILFNGECVLDNIHVKNQILSDEDIYIMNPLDTPEWENSTILLAQFENNSINAGILTTINNPIIKWSVNRKTVGDNVLKELGEVNVETNEFIDYTAQHGKSYIYDIFPITITEIGEVMETNVVTGDFYSWSLTDKDTGTVYLFDLNLKSDNFKNIRDISITNNYTQFANISYGKTDYIQGGINCILGNVSNNGQLNQSVEYVNEFKAFINNGKEKILKNRKGELFYVHTMELENSVLDDNIEDQPYTVSFQFIQTRLSD
jgi:hypothetical protein